MKPWAGLLAAVSLALGAVVVRAADPRFSDTLSTAEANEVGLSRLTPDQAGALDALVRLDLAKPAPRAKDGPPAPTRFSQRLADDERRAAGLTALAEAEIAGLDAFVDRHAANRSARALLAPPVFVASIPRLRRIEEKPATGEIHGSFSLSMGWGKGGYTERTVGGTVNYTSPEGNRFLEIGYWETWSKGGSPYIYRDPLARPLPAGAP